MNRRIGVAAGLAAATAAGAMTTIAAHGGPQVPTQPAAPQVTLGTVVRTNLASMVLTGGTLGYAATNPVLNQLTGTYTWLPAPGRMIAPGHVLFRVDDLPVILMRGRTPAWRPFTPGMTGGIDITELQRNLIALGYAAGLFTAPTGTFDALTVDAVLRWQQASGYPATGQIGLGQIVFLRDPVVIGALTVAPGQPAVPGQAPYEVTGTQRIVIVPLNQQLPSVSVGEHVSIILPSTAITGGTVAAIGPPPATGSAGTGTAGNTSTNSGSSGAGSGSGDQQTSMQLTVTPDRPAVTGTGQDVAVQVSLVTQSVSHVLAVPISALLALAGGGYAVQVAEPSGARRLVAVSVGLFANTLVQVSGPGLQAGMKVVTAQ